MMFGAKCCCCNCFTDLPVMREGWNGSTENHVVFDLDFGHPLSSVEQFGTVRQAGLPYVGVIDNGASEFDGYRYWHGPIGQAVKAPSQSAAEIEYDPPHHNGNGLPLIRSVDGCGPATACEGNPLYAAPYWILAGRGDYSPGSPLPINHSSASYLYHAATRHCVLLAELSYWLVQDNGLGEFLAVDRTESFTLRMEFWCDGQTPTRSFRWRGLMSPCLATCPDEIGWWPEQGVTNAEDGDFIADIVRWEPPA